LFCLGEEDSFEDKIDDHIAAELEFLRCHSQNDNLCMYFAHSFD